MNHIPNIKTLIDIGTGLIITSVVIGLVIGVLTIWAQVNIVRRAGYSGWWWLITLVPVAGLVMFVVFAFVEWPVTRELKQLRAWAGQTGYGYPGYPPSTPYGGNPE